MSFRLELEVEPLKLPDDCTPGQVADRIRRILELWDFDVIFAHCCDASQPSLSQLIHEEIQRLEAKRHFVPADHTSAFASVRQLLDRYDRHECLEPK